MTAVYKRELRSYFNSMIGYIFTAAVMLIIGLYFTIYNLRSGYPYFATALAGTISIFAFTVPLLTMRSMSEERHSKTDQMLLTYPVSVAGVVFGKFLAMLTVFAVPMLFACLCPIVIHLGGNGSFLIDYSLILLFLFLGAMFIAIGMFISSLTESQVIAAVGSMIALLVLLLWDSIVGFIPTTLAAAIVGTLILFVLAALLIYRSAGSPIAGLTILGLGVIATVLLAFLASSAFTEGFTAFLKLFSIYGPLQNFANYYLFDVKGLLFYALFAALFLFLTIQSVQKRRYR